MGDLVILLAAFPHCGKGRAVDWFIALRVAMYGGRFSKACRVQMNWQWKKPTIPKIKSYKGLVFLGKSDGRNTWTEQRSCRMRYSVAGRTMGDSQVTNNRFDRYILRMQKSETIVSEAWFFCPLKTGRFKSWKLEISLLRCFKEHFGAKIFC